VSPLFYANKVKRFGDALAEYPAPFWLMATLLLIGGFLNDKISPRFIWIGGFTIGPASTIGLNLFNQLKNTGDRQRFLENPGM
jgi:hypothetical protein